jgi:hypothetical protein
MKTFTIETDDLTAKYDYLWRLSDDRWAWEYARRSKRVLHYARNRKSDDISEMQAPYANIRLLKSRVHQTMAERLGFAFMPDPKLNGFEADIVWTRYAYPDQVQIHCSPLRRGQTCDIWERCVPICDITHVTDTAGREFLLLRGKGCVVQVRCTGLSLLGMEPVRMNLTISDVDAFDRKVKAQKAVLALLGNGPDVEAPRWTKRTQILRNGLIALDSLEAGLNRREIAEIIYGKSRVDAEWTGPSMKHAMRYVTLKAEALRDGGYLVELLGSQFGMNRTVT